MRPIFSVAFAIASALTASACSLIRDGSQIAREATPSINALLEAGKKNDLTAGLKVFSPAAQHEASLKTLFTVRRDVFGAFTPLPAQDSSYSSISGVFLGNSARLEAKIPNVPGVSLRADVVDMNGWKLEKFEFFESP